MPTRSPFARVTDRDLKLLTLLDDHPYTSQQLFTLSQTWNDRFTHERLLRRRLQQLRDAEWVRSFPLASVTRGGSPHYWKLTRDGFRVLLGDVSATAPRRFFEEISPNHHHHTKCLGDFLTKTVLASHQHGISIEHFARENSVKLEAGGFAVYPDCAFQLRTGDGRTYHYCIELDNGTERVRSLLDTESIERKLRGYDAHQAQFLASNPNRYLVLFVTTRSHRRLDHILGLAASIMTNPERTVFVGVSLDQYLACLDPFTEPIITDHRGLKRTLVPVVSHAREGAVVNASPMTVPVTV